MSIGTPKRLKELVKQNQEAVTPTSHGRFLGYAECWEAVKPVIEAAQRVVWSEHGFTYSPTLEQELRDALEGLGLED